MRRLARPPAVLRRCLTAALGLWLALGSLAPALAATWTVRPGERIQDAIDRAAAGDTVEVQRARYLERLRIDKPLTLRGLERPTVSGGDQGDTIRVSAPDVTIEGLIVSDSGASLLRQNAGIYIEPGAHRAKVQHCFLSYNLFGLWIEKADDVQVLHNNITGKRDFDSTQRGNGVQLYNTKGARLVGNEISFVRDALYIDVSHHAVFRQNRLHHSRYGTHYMNSYYNLWEDNDTWDNRGGLALMEVRNQVIRNNRAWNNADHGIMLRTLQDAVVENNIVMGNNRGLFVYDVEFTELRGNYWSNYRGWDRDQDGRGDIAYEANDMVDRLTWRYPSIRLLLASPAVQALRLVGQQFPLLRVPSVVEPHPRMLPRSTAWAEWRARLLQPALTAP